MSLSVGLIFICIGIPLWWNTTKVYRAALPYDEIEELNQLKVRSLHIILSSIRQDKGTLKLMSVNLN